MITSLSPTLITSRVVEVRRFYETHFSASVVFDCGWYVTLQLGATKETQFSLMTPPTGVPEFQGGLTLNLKVADVDRLHAEVVEGAGLTPVMPLEDHPWGDRGFTVLDPIGTRLYCYHDIPMSPEFQASLQTAP